MSDNRDEKQIIAAVRREMEKAMDYVMSNSTDLQIKNIKYVLAGTDNDSILSREEQIAQRIRGMIYGLIMMGTTAGEVAGLQPKTIFICMREILDKMIEDIEKEGK